MIKYKVQKEDRSGSGSGTESGSAFIFKKLDPHPEEMKIDLKLSFLDAGSGGVGTRAPGEPDCARAARTLRPAVAAELGPAPAPSAPAPPSHPQIRHGASHAQTT